MLQKSTAEIINNILDLNCNSTLSSTGKKMTYTQANTIAERHQRLVKEGLLLSQRIKQKTLSECDFCWQQWDYRWHRVSLSFEDKTKDLLS